MKFPPGWLIGLALMAGWDGGCRPHEGSGPLAQSYAPHLTDRD
jgi:hypothetical protein